MQDGVASWLHSVDLQTGETDLHSSSANNFLFLLQLSNELAHDTITDYITHTIHTYNIIIIHAFLLVIDMQMCGRVIFALAEDHNFGSNSAANRALGLNSLLSHSFTLYYITLE